MLWGWMDMHLDEVPQPGELRKIRKLSTQYALASLSLGSRSDLLQEDLGDSPVGSPQLEESLHR